MGPPPPRRHRGRGPVMGASPTDRRSGRGIARRPTSLAGAGRARRRCRATPRGALRYTSRRTTDRNRLRHGRRLTRTRTSTTTTTKPVRPSPLVVVVVRRMPPTRVRTRDLGGRNDDPTTPTEDGRRRRRRRRRRPRRTYACRSEGRRRRGENPVGRRSRSTSTRGEQVARPGRGARPPTSDDDDDDPRRRHRGQNDDDDESAPVGWEGEENVRLWGRRARSSCRLRWWILCVG